MTRDFAKWEDVARRTGAYEPEAYEPPPVSWRETALGWLSVVAWVFAALTIGALLAIGVPH